MVLTLAIPLTGIKAAIANHSYLWNLPLGRMAIHAGLAAVLYLPLTYLISKGYRWALTTLSWVNFVWVVGIGIEAFQARSSGLGFFSVFVGIFLTATTVWVQHEMNRSYFDPMVSWYESLPKSIPCLVCAVQTEGSRGVFKVSRMDEEGAFLSTNGRLDEGVGEQLFLAGKKELAFVFRDREFRCQGVLIRTLQRGARGVGGGFQFCDLSPDQKKDLGSFVESLRGEGYVA